MQTRSVLTMVGTSHIKYRMGVSTALAWRCVHFSQAHLGTETAPHTPVYAGCQCVPFSVCTQVSYVMG